MSVIMSCGTVVEVLFGITGFTTPALPGYDSHEVLNSGLCCTVHVCYYVM